MATKRLKMQLKVAKWGNSLAVRLPAETSKQIGLQEGDTLTAEVAADGRLMLSPERQPLSASGVRRLRRVLAHQKPTTPVVGEMRRTARY
jgi:antitoxin MazE